MKSDKELYADVMDQLKFIPNVDEKNINILVNNGFISLIGAVDSYIAKNNAGYAVKNIIGVKAVVNELEVKWRASESKH